MIKDRTFYATIRRASGKLRASKNYTPVCSTVGELEDLINSYLNTDRNCAHTAAALGLSYKIVSTRIHLLIKSGVEIETPRIGPPRRPKQTTKKARLMKCCALHLADLQREHGVGLK